MTLARFQASARQCARHFRLGRDVEAALEMVDLFSDLMPPFAEAEPDVQVRWAALLNAMFAGQQAQDWLGLADYLEYELVELLEQVSVA